MSQIQLIIDGVQADVFAADAFPLELDFQIESVTDFTTRTGSGLTRTYKLPGTATNDKLFNLFASTQQDSLTVGAFRQTTIAVDGLTVSEGRAKLVKIDTRSDGVGKVAAAYELKYIADNADWLALLQDCSIKDLQFDDHEFNTSNIRAGFNRNYSSAGDKVVYTLIKWKDWVNQSSGFIVDEDFTTALFIREIVELAFNKIGYTVDSNFLTSAFFDKLILPVALNYGQDYFDNRADVTVEKTTTTSGTIAGFTLICDDDSTAPNMNTFSKPAAVLPNYDTTTGLFTAPYTGSYLISASMDVSNIVAGANDFVIAFIKNGIIITPVASLGYTINDPDTMFLEDRFTLAQGDTIATVLFVGGSVVSYDVTGGFFRSRMQEHTFISGESFVEYQYLLPDYKLIELIAGVAQLFNLVIYGNSTTRNARIEPRSDFFDGTVDKTPFVDGLKQGVKEILTTNLECLYQYTDDDNDGTAEAINEKSSDLPVLSAKYVSNDVTRTGTKTVENVFFAPTVHIIDATIAGYAGDDRPPQIPLIWGENYDEISSITSTNYDFLPRILYHKGLIIASTGGAQSPEGSISYNSSGALQTDDWPKSFSVNYTDPNGTDPTLSFKTELTDLNSERPGLLERYHLDHLATINQAVSLSCFMRYKLTDIVTEDFRNKYQINANDYILQKIEAFTPLKQQSTKIILQEIKCAEQSDVDAIEGTPLNAIYKESI